MIDSPTAAADARAERRSKYHEADVVVVGAGVFGCAIAYALAQQGRSVILLERWMKEPDRIVGELLQPGGIVALRQLGLADALEGIDAVPCYGYKVSFHGEGVDIPYPSFDENGRMIHASSNTGTTSSSAKQKEGRSFHHGRFIMNLRKACQRQENITIFETEVTATIRGDDKDTVLGNVLAEFHWRRKSLTSIINVLAMALYALFAANDRQLRALQMGCFQYFQRGHASEPMALMGGLLHQPSKLAYHFFSVAFLAIWLNALDLMSGSVFGFLKAPLALIDGILILWRASVVFLPVMWRELN
ncbi:squalene epoxidase [Colletotrichum tofieldiae]|nr:squalene epoxidase [Colletotrichum tofieldiae]GKT80115.1 squalene epoxidase [Colletotrichum tofieldiae]GKT85322.1 squalene epoxidase [Colletotrichum tofieldiae]